MFVEGGLVMDLIREGLAERSGVAIQNNKI
jgi:hypothetical protein